MTSITVTFNDTWLTDVTDPTVSVHATDPDRSRQTGKSGRFAELAGGRIRVITSAHRTRTFPLTMQLLTDAEALLLESWQGRIILLRDSAGRRVFGSFLVQSEADYFDDAGTLHDVSLTFTEVTYSEHLA